MTPDETEIRTLVENWAAAVRRGDLDGVLADHAPDIVMFDVPPPYEGVRGLAGYRETWPPFFEWQASGASFDIESLEVVAGSSVAYAFALLRCGTPEELADRPENLLRLTLGLRRQEGRWAVCHEHHSFPSSPSFGGAEEVRAVHSTWSARTEAKDLDGLMAAIAEDVVSYEHEEPLQYVGRAAVREVCARGLEVPGSVSWTVPDLRVLARDDLAVAWGLNRIRRERPDGEVEENWSRGTRVFQYRKGGWVMVHQHVSFPRAAARDDLRS